jgi:hypothetical protein
MSEAIRVQVEMTVSGIPKGMQIGRSLAEEVLTRWIRTGTLPAGFTVRAIHWDRGATGKRTGSAKTQEDINLVVRRLLRRVPLSFSEIRIS